MCILPDQPAVRWETGVVRLRWRSICAGRVSGIRTGGATCGIDTRGGGVGCNPLDLWCQGTGEGSQRARTGAREVGKATRATATIPRRLALRSAIRPERENTF